MREARERQKLVQCTSRDQQDGGSANDRSGAPARMPALRMHNPRSLARSGRDGSLRMPPWRAYLPPLIDLLCGRPLLASVAVIC